MLYKSYINLSRLVYRRRVLSSLKYRLEYFYWKYKKFREGKLKSDHYVFYYTTYFELSMEDYRGKRILDVGCGPRGSLEWCSMAKQRVGLDPLVNRYKELGIREHQMTYLEAYAEEIPLPSGSMDIVCSFNSIDHTDNYQKALAEIYRVLLPNGLFLLITDIHPIPALCEPSVISWGIIEELEEKGFQCLNVKKYKGIGAYGAIRSDNQLETGNLPTYGVLTGKFRKIVVQG